MDENMNRDVNPQEENRDSFNAQPTGGYYQSYTPPVNSYYQPPKPPEKKKKGALVALLLVVGVLLLSAMILGYRILSYSGPEEAPKGDDTKLDLVQPPASEEKNPADGPLSAKEIYKKVHESSVGVIVYSGNATHVYSEGTGVVMGYNSDKTATYIITCAHVINAKNPKFVVQTADGEQFDAYIVGLDVKTDIGVLRVMGTDLKPADFADSSALEVGDEVYAIGNPGGMQFFGSFTNGIVSAIARPVNSPVGYEVACVQHTAPINPGNSGGALVNEYGQVVGINSSKIASEDYEGMGFAVPSSTVKEIVDELIKNGYVSNRPVLGVNFMPATQNQTYSIIVKANKLPAGSIIISSIMNGSDLLNTEVKEGDMIIAVNGKDLDTYEVLLEVIENGKVGDVITLTICRVDSNYNITTFDVNLKLVEDSSTSQQQEETTDNGFYFPFGN